MAIAYVGGGNSGSIIVSPTSPISFTLNIPAASLVCVTTRCTSASANFTAMSVNGVSCTVKSFLAFGSNSQIQLGYLWNFGGNSSSSVSCTYTGTAGYAIVTVDWFSGIQTSSDPFDTSATGTGGGSVTSGAYTTAQASELAYAFASAEQTSSSWTAGSGFTAAQAAPGSNGVAAFSEYQVYTTTQTSVTASATGNGSGAASGIYVALFKGAAAAAGGNNNRLMMMGCGT
jgi:hypothetical protein